MTNRFVDREKNTRKLLNALRVIESNDFRHCVPINTDLLDELLSLVASEIEKKQDSLSAFFTPMSTYG